MGKLGICVEMPDRMLCRILESDLRQNVRNESFDIARQRDLLIFFVMLFYRIGLVCSCIWLIGAETETYTFLLFYEFYAEQECYCD